MATVSTDKQTRLTHFGIQNRCSIFVFSQNWSWKDEKRIMEETGCHNDGLIHTYLAVGSFRSAYRMMMLFRSVMVMSMK